MLQQQRGFKCSPSNAGITEGWTSNCLQVHALPYQGTVSLAEGLEWRRILYGGVPKPLRVGHTLCNFGMSACLYHWPCVTTLHCCILCSSFSMRYLSVNGAGGGGGGEGSLCACS